MFKLRYRGIEVDQSYEDLMKLLTRYKVTALVTDAGVEYALWVMTEPILKNHKWTARITIDNKMSYLSIRWEEV